MTEARTQRMSVQRAAQAVADALCVRHLPGWQRISVQLRPHGSALLVEVTEVAPRPGPRAALEWTGRDEDVQRRHLCDAAANLRESLRHDGVPWDGTGLSLHWPTGANLLLEVTSGSTCLARIPLSASHALIDEATARALSAAFVTHGPAAPPASSCNYDAERAELVTPDGTRANAQFVGSFAPEDGTWLWGWANPHAGSPACTAAVEWACRAASGAVFSRGHFTADLALAEHLACFVAQQLRGRPLVARGVGYSFYVK